MESLNIITGELNLDESRQFMPKGDYPNARNMVVGTPVSGDKTRIEKIIGTSAITHSLGYTVTKVLGACTDTSNGTTYIFANTSTGNKIISLSSEETLSTVVSYDFGWLDETRISDCFFIQNSLIWIDNSDEIKRLPLGIYPTNPSAGALDAREIGLMKKPPLQPPYPLAQMESFPFGEETVRGSDYQFAYYFEYIDGGRSVLSPVSKIIARKNHRLTAFVPLHEDSMKEYKSFRIYANIETGDVEGGSTFPAAIAREGATEIIPKSVRKIVFCGKRIGSSTWYEISKVERLTDATQDTKLGKFEKDYIPFEGTLSGIVVPSDMYETQHFVPRNPQSITVADSRVLASNFYEGKSFPDISSVLNPRSEIDKSILDSGETRSDILKMDYYAITWNASKQAYDYVKQATTEYVYFDEQNGYFDTDYNAGTYTKGDTITVGAPLDLSGSGAQNKSTTYYRYIEDRDGREKDVKLDLLSLSWEPEVSFWKEMGCAGGIEPENTVFSSDSTYKVAAVFSDDFGRKSDVGVLGEVEFGPNKISAAGISYEINIDELDMPSWAKSVDVLLSTNTEKEMLIAGRATHVAYSKNDQDGNEFKSGSFATPNNGLAIGIEGMVRQGLGYEFQEGDRIKLFKLEEGATDTVKVDILDEPITHTEGYYVFISGNDYTNDGIINPWEDYSVEIYRKRTTNTDSLFYGNGQTHILSPGRNTIKGVLSGDMFIDFRRRFIPFDTGDGVPGVREGFIADQGGAFTYEPTMTLDDDGLWIGPKGKTYIETNFGEIHKENYVRWGGRTINDTKINGLGEFMALDEEVTPIEYGGINRMVLVGDNQSNGSVVLALTAIKPISLYIGGSVMVNSDGTSTPIRSEKVIGLVRPQENDHGTLHPDSVFSKDGKVYWYDHTNRCMCMYAANGVHNISKNKVSTFFRDIPLKTSDVICGYYDIYNMLMISVKNGHSGTSETIGFDTEEGKWKGFFDVNPDVYFHTDDVMYMVEGNSFTKSTKLPDDSIPRSSFFGVTYPSEIELVFNENPQEPKLWTVLALNVKPDALEWSSNELRFKDTGLIVELESENGQRTNIIAEEFEFEDGVAYASIPFDINSEGGISNGDEMNSNQITAKLISTDSNNIQLGVVRMKYDPISGHIL
jgi:hypothetical protein